MNASIDKLHDFYQPALPAWTPQTIGCYIVFAVIGFLVLWMIVRGIRRRIANRYRRDALRELTILPADQFSALLKRTALAAWPRETVARLSGESWLNFLDKATEGESFHSSPGNRIEDIALRSTAVSADDEQQLRDLAAKWIRRHRAQA